MAWIRTGAVNVVNGSQAVVGVGTDWLSSKADAEDEIVLPDGKGYEIQTVNSATSITLTTPYLGASQNGQGYSIKRISVAARMLLLATKAGELVQQYATIALQAGVGKFGAGAIVNALFRPSLRGLSDEGTGVNFPGAGVMELWLAGTRRALFAADGTPSGDVWAKAPVSAAVSQALATRAGADATLAALATKASVDTVSALTGVVEGKAVPGHAGEQSPRNRALGTGAYRDETVLHGSAPYAATDIAVAARPTVSVPVAGAEIGDYPDVSLSVSPGGIEPRADVTAAGVVTVKLVNPTAAPINLGALTVYVRVTKRVPE